MPEMVRWNFNPFRPVRIDHMGEVVFMQAWQKLMGGDPEQEHDRYMVENYPGEYPVTDLFGGYPPSERETRVASSFILFLGTGVGQGYRAEAKSLAEKLGWDSQRERGKAYVATWAFDNARLQGAWGFGGFYYRRDVVMEPEPVQLEDIPTLDQAADWLGTDAGQAFLDQCEAELMRRNRMRYQQPKLTPVP